MRAEKSQAVLKTGQKRHKKTPSPELPFMAGCFFISPTQFVSFIPATVCASGYPGWRLLTAWGKVPLRKL
jgi:hypothetical protein